MNEELHIKREDTNFPPKGLSICEPWILFSVGAMIGLASSNFIMSMLGDLGLGVVKYYNVGPLVFSSLYFSV